MQIVFQSPLTGGPTTRRSSPCALRLALSYRLNVLEGCNLTSYRLVALRQPILWRGVAQNRKTRSTTIIIALWEVTCRATPACDS